MTGARAAYQLRAKKNNAFMDVLEDIHLLNMARLWRLLGDPLILDF